MTLLSCIVAHFQDVDSRGKLKQEKASNNTQYLPSDCSSSLKFLLIPIAQQLARILDRPLFPWKNVLVGFSLGQFVLEGLLSFRQYKVLQRTAPPKVLANEVSQKVYDQSQVRASLEQVA